tara:strand:+ start:276 stop:632 length:357 start_codon:yes stop_codon:yes gene_type:complete
MNGAVTKQFPTRLCSDQVVTILDAETTSNAANLTGTSLVAIDIPAGLEGTSMTFEVSTDGVTYRQYRRLFDGVAVTAVVGADGSYATLVTDFAGYNFIKLVTDTQTSDIDFTLKTRPL